MRDIDPGLSVKGGQLVRERDGDGRLRRGTTAIWLMGEGSRVVVVLAWFVNDRLQASWSPNAGTDAVTMVALVPLFLSE